MDGFEKLPAVEEKGCLLQGGVSRQEKQQWKGGRRMTQRLD